jgi:hypothetical protein
MLELGRAHAGEAGQHIAQSAASAAAAAGTYWHCIACVHGETRAPVYARTMHDNRSQLPAAAGVGWS